VQVDEKEDKKTDTAWAQMFWQDYHHLEGDP
jgi:hypothetical protein